jgi:NADH dehydrogenase [ubiquinone] 1 alpha subcomplex assembly factor 7
VAAEGGMSAPAQPTPLARVLVKRIARDGPISVRDYMAACLHDPEHGYYRTRAAIGANEDFITAPEISQVFGELIGLWAAVVWQQMGSPGRLRLVEIGPGRGTLMRDALRASSVVPAFRAAIEVVLVEPNAALQAIQYATLVDIDARLRWCADFATLADDPAAAAPAIVLANEILDVIPITQLQRTDTGWIERGVGVNDAGGLVFGILGAATPPHIAVETRSGDIVEQRDTRGFTEPLRRIADAGPLAALFMDYGYAGPAVGDTLQAVRAQSYRDPLASPGADDLTAHVDFAAFAAEARALGLAADGPRSQSAYLGSLGILERTSRLMAANPALAASLEAATARLIAPTGMGARFKAIGLRSPGLPPLPGL